MRDANIDTLIRGSTLKGRSSQSLNWQEMAVERRTIEPHYRQEETLDQHYIILWFGQPTVVDLAYNGRLTRMVKQPGTLSMGSAGIRPAVRAHSPYDVIACVLSPAFVDQCALESDWGNTASLYEHLGLADDALSALLRLAAQEVQAGGPTGRLYAESLMQAIASRFMRIATDIPLPLVLPGGLPPHILRRVLDRIAHDFSHNLSLADLAMESGYSRAHFIRMFRASTGYAPHHYLMKVRLEYVQQELRRDDASLSELASAAGFSSHSHLTQAFRRSFGVTPSTYRTENSTRLIVGVPFDSGLR